MFFLLVSLMAGLVLFWHVPSMEHIPPYRRNETVKEKMSVIIPARNEERNLQALLASIHAQSMLPFEIIVVNDQSEDQTREIASKYGVRLIDNPELPAGWLGKSWACWNGANAAKGEWLVFLDADTVIEKNGLARLAENFERKAAYGLLTVHPYHKIKKPYESLSALFHLIIIGSFGPFLPFAQKVKPKGAFGQCLVCTKEEYFSLGGHEAIRAEVVENMALGKLAAAKGRRVFAMSGCRAVSMRMYPNGIKELAFGWAKSFASGAGTAPFWCLLLIVIWIGGILSFVFQLPKLWTEEWLPYALIYAAFVIQLSSALRKIGNFRFLQLLVFPLHALFFLAVFILSFFLTFIKKNAKWKGRNIILEKNKAADRK
ncbi:glycosyltransferase [Metabacillus sp. GX 13764]|uniref:glycosyltransferase n=1 Tax=Metabacillus kandeliae TaxID=2900151 RepID=UPI001E331EAE|nr:glycosyltransferase family 2 protein [Metabacillus kandeliae]MCD7036120.1 glycosyltransferase [Metabacillus kandeliae]